MYEDDVPDIMAAPKMMTGEEIEELRKNWVAAYQCDDSAITFDFQKITDVLDDAHDTCLRLIYSMTTDIARREIFSINMPVPDELRIMANQILREQRKRFSGDS